jgi:predicted metal-dependent hydrolase
MHRWASLKSNRPARAGAVKRALLRLEDRTVEIVLRANPRARRFIVKVDPSTGEVSVVAPSSRSLERALDFARKERDWIAERLADVPKPVPLEIGSVIAYRGVEHVVRLGEMAEGARRRAIWIEEGGARPVIRVAARPEHAPRRVLDWLKREARRHIDAKVMAYAARLDVRPKRIAIRDTSSRWGSCSSTRSLSFSWRLILAPPDVLDYVVAHEIAHLREMNHGPRFWKLVEKLVPDCERPQAWLAAHGALLHRYAPRVRPYR